MSAQVERDPIGAGAGIPLANLPSPGAVAPVAFDPESEGGPQLPGDHPAWARDRLAISFKARELLARLKPIVLQVRSFWDHHVRSIPVGGRRVSIDSSGSYRLE